MEAVASFAAARRDRMREADSDLAPMVLSALTQWTADGDWYAELIDDASVLWLEAFEAEAPNADPDLFIGRFRDMLGEALSQTKEPSNPPTDAEVNRVTRWLSTATLNNATYLGNGAHGGKGMRWVTMRDSSVRETHRAANGEIADSDGTFDIGGYDLHYPGEPVGPPEIWINCVVGSTQVEWSGQDVIAVTRREHTGTFVKVRTGNGHELTITPNHPVLTSGGYVPARLLRPGDQVMATSLPVAPEVGNTPPSIEQVYRAAREHGMVGRVGGSAVNFHGDVAESEVEVVWPDSNLPLEVGGECREPALVGAHGREVPLVGNGLPGAGASVPAGRVPVGGILPAGSSVGGSYDVTSFLRSHPRHADAVRLGPITDRKAEGFQATEDDVPADTEFLAHLEYALASGMALVDIVEVELYSATHEVYNLHTSENWYNANSIMTHNCRCILVPARVEGALTVSPITAAITDEVDVEDIPVDELEDGEEEVTEIPVHGVAAIEGRPTGDGRKFALGAVTFGDLPQPLGYEFESSHGGGNSRVAIVGRIDEFFKVEVDDIVEIRFRGVIFPGKPYAAQAIEGIIDQSYRGLSVIVDDMALDVETTKADFDATEDGQTVVETLSAARIRRFDMVPTGAYQEGWLNLGHEFASELGDDALAACAACAGGDDDEDDENIERGYDLYDDQMITVNLGRIGEEELAALDALSVEEQIQYQIEHGMVEAIESYREVSTAERRKLAEEGKALPDGSFPIATEEDLENAIQAIGRASNPDEVKALIKKRAADLGRSDLVPEDWALVASAFAPSTHDGPGWITHPIPTGRIRRYWVRGKGAAKIRWGVPGDFNRCRRQLAKYIVNPKWLAGACANMHREALGVWPGQEKGFGSKSEGMSMSVALVASGTVIEKPADAFKDPGFSRLTPLTIDGDRIYGHLAQWGVCHIGIQDVCVTAPHSSTNYSMYRTGVVFTDEGRLPVGQITMGTGHASIKANAKEAVAHYDNTGSVVADVVAGEDAFGIWFAGLLRPGLTPERIAQLAASALSGDWRRTMTGLELVAALAVNVPGYPIPRVSLSASALAGQESLVAAGIVELDAVTAGLVPSSEEIAGIVRTAVDEYRHAEAREARIEALRPFGDKAREHSLARIATYFEGE